MSASPPNPPPPSAASSGAWRTLVRGLQLSPELRDGLGVTLLLALLATGGRIVVPIAVERTLNRGILAQVGVDLSYVAWSVGLAAVAVLATAVAGYGMNYRLTRTTETALAGLRVRAFRHIHDLSMLHHAAEHRGSLVSRVTADVDEISQFMQWGGVMLLVNAGQLVLATVAMLFYSWQLTLVVLISFAPLGLVLRWFQRRLSVLYDIVRERVGTMLTVIGESVVGADVIRAYSIEGRTNQRVAKAVDRQFQAGYHAARTAAFMFTSGEIFAAAATAAAVIAGVLLGLDGGLSDQGRPWVGDLVAFMFLATLFVAPVQVGTEVLDEAQTAIAGWRRVLTVLDTPPDVADPGEAGTPLPPGPVTVGFEHVSFRYPLSVTDGEDSAPADGEGPVVLHDVHLQIPAQSRVAIVGETGSGKTTFAKLLTRLMDPSQGRVLVNGVALDTVPFSELRRRIVMVPQDGFLFDTSIADNVRQGRPAPQAPVGGGFQDGRPAPQAPVGGGRPPPGGRPELSDDDIRLAFTELGLADWLQSLPEGLHTRVGERGESLSVGERQLVALARAYVANPDLLVLDEATSAVDPATEVRLQRALEGLTRGRTAISIAHRLSTAEAADEVLVFDGGEVVQRGPHAELVGQSGVYAGLYDSWSHRHAHAG